MNCPKCHRGMACYAGEIFDTYRCLNCGRYVFDPPGDPEPTITPRRKAGGSRMINNGIGLYEGKGERNGQA